MQTHLAPAPTEEQLSPYTSQQLTHCLHHLLGADGRSWSQWAAAHVLCRATRQVLARHYFRRHALAAPRVAELFAALAALHTCGALINDALADNAPQQAARADWAAVQAHLRGAVALAVHLRE